MLWAAFWAPLGALLLAGGYMGEGRPAMFGDPAQGAEIAAALRSAALWALGLGLGGSGMIAGLLRGLPRMTGTKLRSERLANLGVLAWNIAALAAVGGVVMPGGGQTGLLRDAPWGADLALGVAAIPLILLVARTHAHSRTPGWHPAVWWLSLGLVGAPLAFLIGGAVWDAPWPLNPGAAEGHAGGSAGGADALLGPLQAQWVAALVVAPLVISLLTYLVQAETGAALHSGRLAHFGVWSWVLLAPLAAVGLLHPENSSSGAVKNIASIASALLLIPLSFTLANLFLTARGHGAKVFTTPSLRFAAAAGVLLMGAFIHLALAGTRQLVAPVVWDQKSSTWHAVTCAEGALGCTSFASSWSLGLMAGAAAFAGFAGAYHFIGRAGLLSKIPEGAILGHWWAALAGVAGIYASVAFSGFAESRAAVEGWDAARLAAALDAQYALRAACAALFLLGALVFAFNARVALAKEMPVEEGEGLDLRAKEDHSSVTTPSAAGGAH
jgi:cbb3-type cytochrome oxidase subunit 1